MDKGFLGMRILIVILLMVSLANGQVRKYEAENMTVIGGPVVMSTDSSMIFWSWGTISFYCDLTGDVKLTIRAKEDTAGAGHALLEVESPGSLALDTLVIDQQNFSDFVIWKDGVMAGNYQLSFLNDIPQARNVHVDYVIVELLDQVPDTAKIYISWLPNSETDLKGYKVYWGLTSRKYLFASDAGNVLTKTIDGLKFNRGYYAAVTAYDTANNESAFSKEVSIVLEPLEITPPDTLLGDYNNDGNVDFLDMIEFDKCFGATSFSISYNRYFDFDDDGEVDFSDMVIFDKCFGKSERY